jgi:drug/metabolite transporter (DMT)-like permease
MRSRTAAVEPKHWVAFAVLGVIWGTTWVAADSLAEQIPPLLGAAARFLLSAVLLIPVILWKRLTIPRGRALGFVLLLSFTMVVLPSLLLLWARPQLPSATVAVLYAGMPLMVVLLTNGLEGSEVPGRAMPATIVGMGAIALALGASFSAAQAGAAAVVFVAVALTGGSSLVARREFRSLDPLLVTAVLLGAAALLLWGASVGLERGQPAHWNRNAIGSLIFLAGVGGAPAYAVYFWLLQRTEAYQTATVQWIEPLVAMIEGAVLLRMGLSLTMIAGVLVTFVSLLVVMRARGEDDDTVSLLGN